MIILYCGGVSEGGGEELQKRLESKQEVIDVLDLRKVGEPSIVYKNRRSNEIITIDEGPMEMPSTHTLFRFTENIPPQNWVILDDTLTVLGYLCQKATTVFRGRNYTVCFTMEIPVDDGPWKLYGRYYRTRNPIKYPEIEIVE